MKWNHFLALSINSICVHKKLDSSIIFQIGSLYLFFGLFFLGEYCDDLLACSQSGCKVYWNNALVSPVAKSIEHNALVIPDAKSIVGINWKEVLERGILLVKPIQDWRTLSVKNGNNSWINSCIPDLINAKSDEVHNRGHQRR